MTDKPLTLVVPIKPLTRTICDITQQATFGKPVAVLDITRGPLARFDGIQKLAYVPGRVGDFLGGKPEVLLLLPVNINFVLVIVRDQSCLRSFEDDAAAHVIETRPAIGMKCPGQYQAWVFA